MRTTVRLPDDLYAEVRSAASVSGRTITAFLEDAVRVALVDQSRASSRPAYRVQPFAGRGLQPGVDLDDSSALMDLMDLDARD